MSFLFVSFLQIIQPSANSLVLQAMFLQISFTYTRDSSETKLPCGTPEVTLTSLDSCPPTLTLCLRPTRYLLTQTTTLESTPEVASSVSCGRWWGTESKPLEKSVIIASIPTPLSKQPAMSWHTVMTWLSHQHPGLNPRCPSYNQSFLSHFSRSSE